MSMAVGSSDKEKVKKINLLYKQLLSKYGMPSVSGQWKIWCKRPKSKTEKEIIIIESILTQRANWKNVELAVSQLKKACLLNLQSITEANLEFIANLIKPSGFYRQKAERLKELAEFFIKDISGIENAEKIETFSLREKLLSIRGVGKETADDILLYAFERPVFVIDEYTKRFVKKHNLSKILSYNFLQNLFENAVKKDYKIYQDYHALIVIDMKVKNDKKRHSNIYS